MLNPASRSSDLERISLGMRNSAGIVTAIAFAGTSSMLANQPSAVCCCRHVESSVTIFRSEENQPWYAEQRGNCNCDRVCRYFLDAREPALGGLLLPAC